MDIYFFLIKNITSLNGIIQKNMHVNIITNLKIENFSSCATPLQQGDMKISFSY